MGTAEILTKLHDCLEKHVQVMAPEGLTMETKLEDDLEMDSLDAVEFLMAIEDVFDLSIEEEDAADFETIGDWVRYLERRLA